MRLDKRKSAESVGWASALWRSRWIDVARYGLMIVLLAALGCASRAPDRVDLEVGIFKWIPDGATAIERLERDFERAHPGIDLDLRLVDPYADDAADDGLALAAELTGVTPVCSRIALANAARSRSRQGAPPRYDRRIVRGSATGEPGIAAIKWSRWSFRYGPPLGSAGRGTR